MKKDLTITTKHRSNCPRCKRPQIHCYCSQIKQIHSKICFVILIHPIEARRKIATGRMSHLCLANSVLICGDDLTDNVQVNEIIHNPDNHCLILYPHPSAVNLSSHSVDRKKMLFKNKKKTVVFVIDGTWRTARKTMRLSKNLQKLASICFIPTTPSQFKVRKQPAEHCYSSIEAIDTVLKLVESKNINAESESILMIVFKEMVERQMQYLPKS